MLKKIRRASDSSHRSCCIWRSLQNCAEVVISRLSARNCCDLAVVVWSCLQWGQPNLVDFAGGGVENWFAEPGFWVHSVGFPQESSRKKEFIGLSSVWTRDRLVQPLPLNGGTAEKSSFDSRYQFRNLRGQIVTLESPTFVCGYCRFMCC